MWLLNAMCLINPFTSPLLNLNSILFEHLLVERVSGTTSNQNVQNWIIHYFNQLGWKVEKDQFVDQTPFGQKQFTNIIADPFPFASEKIIVACHFDRYKIF